MTFIREYFNIIMTIAFIIRSQLICENGLPSEFEYLFIFRTPDGPREKRYDISSRSKKDSQKIQILKSSPVEIELIPFKPNTNISV